MPKDTILYTISDGTVNFLKSINPDGSGDTPLASYTADSTKAVAPNPTKANEFAFAAIDTSGPTAKLYKGTSALNPATSTQLTPTVFLDIDDVQFTPDGNFVIFKADSGLGYKMYVIPVSGGSETVLDDVFEMSVNPVVGTHLVAYSKPLATTSEVYTIDYTTATQTPITNLGTDVFFPTWSRDGGTILFSYSPSALQNPDLYKVLVSSGVVTQITNTPNDVETFGFYNSDKSKIASILFDGGGSLNLAVMNGDGSGAANIVSNNSLGVTCYWTDTNGRRISANLPHFQFGTKSRRIRK